MKDHHTNDQEGFEEMALPSGHIAQIVKDTSNLKAVWLRSLPMIQIMNQHLDLIQVFPNSLNP